MSGGGWPISCDSTGYPHGDECGTQKRASGRGGPEPDRPTTSRQPMNRLERRRECCYEAWHPPQRLNRGGAGFHAQDNWAPQPRHRPATPTPATRWCLHYWRSTNAPCLPWQLRLGGGPQLLATASTLPGGVAPPPLGRPEQAYAAARGRRAVREYRAQPTSSPPRASSEHSRHPPLPLTAPLLPLWPGLCPSHGAWVGSSVCSRIAPQARVT